MPHEKTRKIVTMAFLIAAHIILSRFLSIATPIVKIGFSFLPVALMAALYGPLMAGVGCAVSDYLGAQLFPTGPYFPGFTLTALLVGILYGIFLHREDGRLPWRNIALAAATALLLELLLNTLWVAIITGKGYLALFPARVTKTVLMFPVQVAAIGLLIPRLLSLRLPRREPGV